MIDPHIPDLDAICKLESGEIQFYSAIGAVMSLHAVLEQDYFYIFEAGTNLPQERAARIFYKVRHLKARREMADEAIRPKLNDEGEADWAKLYQKMITVTGSSGHRNFLGHGAVRHQPRIQGFGAGFGPGFARGSDERFFVSQDEIQILAKSQKPREEDLRSTVGYIGELITLLGAIRTFFARFENGEFAR